MKYPSRTLSLLLCCMLAGGFCAYGNEKTKKNVSKNIDIIKNSMKITVNTVMPPMAKTTGTVGANAASSKNVWGQVDLKFRTDNVKEAKKRFIDNPELDVVIATYQDIEKDKKSKDKKTVNKNKCIVFSGKLKYITIEQDGSDHYMKALLPGIIFRRFAYDRTLDRSILAVKMTLKGNGKIIGTAYGSNKSLTKDVLEKFFKSLPKNYVDAKNTIYGRYGTSWNVIDVNKYELEKIPGHDSDNMVPRTEFFVDDGNSPPKNVKKQKK